MALELRDIEVLERIIYESNDNTKEDLMRVLEALCERIDYMEQRLSVTSMMR